MKLREFWIKTNGTVGIVDDHSLVPCNAIHVREVSPSMDEAWAEAERALKLLCNETFHRLGGIDDCVACNALFKLKSARGE